MGRIDLLGLNVFGRNAGMNPLHGTLIGGGVAGGTALMLKRRGALNADLKGFGAGIAVAAFMYFIKKSRHAAFGAAAGAFFASGLSWVANRFLGPAATTTPEAAAAVSGMGLPQLQYLNGNMGIPQVQYLNGGLGLPGIAPVPQSYGTIPGVAGPNLGGAPVDLLGPGTSQSGQISLLGGPTISGLSSAYGATLLGGGRN